jgi:hypothetical protein
MVTGGNTVANTYVFSPNCRNGRRRVKGIVAARGIQGTLKQMELFGGLMKVIVQRLTKKLYLRKSGAWAAERSEAAQFKTVVDALMFCIHCHEREVKLVGQNEAGDDVFLYPFGGDPAVRLELRRLRKSVRESRRLKTERRFIRGRLDALMAQGKEQKKQFPFEPRHVAGAQQE